MRFLIRVSIGLLSMILLGACSKPETESVVDNKVTTVSPLKVYSVNYPLAAMAARIGGDLIEVGFPAPVGEDPAYWRPGAEVVGDYQQADLVLLNGADYAKWLSRVSLPEERLINTGLAFRDQWLPLQEATTHSHGLQGDHTHLGYALTTWLDFELAAQQAHAIAEAFMAAMPEHWSLLQQRSDEAQAQLRQWDRRLRVATQALWQAQIVIFSHPVYQYFQQRYKVDGFSLYWEPDEMPTEMEWQQLDAQLKLFQREGRSLQWMVWEAQPLPEIVAKLRQRKLRVVVIDTLATRGSAGEWTAAEGDLFWRSMESTVKNLELLFEGSER